MSKTFRRALGRGTGYSFNYQGLIYRVIDDITIYQYDTDTVYFMDIDF